MGCPNRRRRFLLITGLAVLAAVLGYHYYDPLYRSFNGAKAGVHFQGENMSRLLREEVALVVAEAARGEGREPVNAVIEPETGAVIPELNGIELNQPLTVDRIMSAPRETTVKPEYRQVEPALRLDDYPSLVICKGNPGKPAVGLMINVAWNLEDSLQSILEVLQTEKAGGTFFVTGRWAEKNYDLIHRIFAEGHELASHGYSDAEVFPDLSAEEMAVSLRKTSEIIYEVTGQYPRYFTPHKGEYNPLTLEVVSRHGMRTLLWTLDTVDWMKPGVEAMKTRIMNGLSPGAIILMHPTENTAVFLAQTLPLIKQQGLKVVAMNELLSPEVFYGFED